MRALNDTSPAVYHEGSGPRPAGAPACGASMRAGRIVELDFG